MKHGEAVNLIYRNSTPSFYEISDINVELKKLNSSFPLSIKQLLELTKILKLADDLKSYFDKEFLDISQYPILSEYFSNLYSNKSIINKISNCIIDENTIDDKASNNLHSIRKKQKSLELDIKNKLNNMLHSSTTSKYIQENLVTTRNGRFVIPIKEEYRSQVKGFIHDISNAGSTVFIEPTSVFELNNELNKLKIEEDLEIEKILFELSSLFFPFTNELSKNVQLIGRLDFIFAKAKYSKILKASTPIINSQKFINLKNARHPLIDFNKVVPFSLNLGTNFNILLITGPNTGGKTVTLKTIGLLLCMAYSGLNIPCDENSSIYVFDNIFADIGDDQSIIDSLSTFSSHMTNIVEITKVATSESLILVDELGSGTDPLEGANLAISILDYFKNIGSLAVATTHYQELKQYALVTNGFENASVEFDLATLSPTYKLLIGIPGKSNAFEISKKLGLSDSIINKAKSYINSEQIDIENLLKNIYDTKSLIENEKIEIENKLSKISSLEKSLEQENDNLKNKKQKILNDATIQARNILLDAKEEANDIIKKIENSSYTKDIQNMRNDLNSKIKSLNNSITTSNLDTTSNSTNTLTTEQIESGMEVFVTTLGKNGIIISSHPNKSNEVQVQIGNIKTNINLKNLRKIDNLKTQKNTNTTLNNYVQKTKTVNTEINVIGLNIEEANFVIDKFLDDCSLAKLQTVRIIHGKGTGKLKNGIHQFLKNHPHVKSYRLGTYGEGETGVTIVTLL